jgi:hypothetical protein
MRYNGAVLTHHNSPPNPAGPEAGAQSRRGGSRVAIGTS